MTSQPVPLPFTDRTDAGRQLVERVRPLAVTDPIVVALPRGGVPVGAELARALHLPLDVLMVRKVGLPGQPELGVGAVAEDGEVELDDAFLDRIGLARERLSDTIESERAELRRRLARYRGERPAPRLAGRDVVVVDDGLATGGTALAALHTVRRKWPARLVLAVPVAAAAAMRRVRQVADDVVALAAPEDFRAVGEWYRDFAQVSDRDVTELLERWRFGAPAASDDAPRRPDSGR